MISCIWFFYCFISKSVLPFYLFYQARALGIFRAKSGGIEYFIFPYWSGRFQNQRTHGLSNLGGTVLPGYCTTIQNYFFIIEKRVWSFFLAQPEIFIWAGLPVKKPVKNLICRFLENEPSEFFQTLVIDAAWAEEFFGRGHISWFWPQGVILHVFYISNLRTWNTHQLNAFSSLIAVVKFVL